MKRLFLLLTLLAAPLYAQRTIPAHIQPFVAVNAAVVAITHVRVLDGTGAPAKTDQTIIIEGENIKSVGPSASTQVPAGAEVIDATGQTVIPGMVGLHDHMYYSSAAGGSMKMMLFSYPRLFLANGLTTIRTAGSTDSYQELNLRSRIDSGISIGPKIFVTGPYLQGGSAGANGPMHPLSGPDDARRTVKYWAEEGVTWFKAYTQVSRAELGAAIDEAHKNGIKVTAHLCSVGYREAVALGIDNLEHGLFANSEFYANKQPDACPQVGDSAIFATASVDNPEVQKTIQEMVKHKVSLTSTLAVYETSTPTRVQRDQRVLDALMPDAAAAVDKWYTNAPNAKDANYREVLKKTMAFEKAFFKAGGLLGAGADPCCLHVIAGYGDQRNYELLVEAGFTPEEAVQVMTLNSAKILGIGDRVGSIAAGKQADLVLLRGNPAATPSDIRNVVTVFKKGTGYDSAKLVASVKGQVGIK